MKLKNGTVLQIVEPLSKIAKKELPALKALKLKDILNELSDKHKALLEVKNNLIKKYGKEEDGRVRIPEDDKEALDQYFKEYNELINDEKEYNIEKVELNEDDLKGIKLSAEDMAKLENLVEFNL